MANEDEREEGKEEERRAKLTSADEMGEVVHIQTPSWCVEGSKWL